MINDVPVFLLGLFCRQGLMCSVELALLFRDNYQQNKTAKKRNQGFILTKVLAPDPPSISCLIYLIYGTSTLPFSYRRF
jgi:hypothetical protein